MLPVTATDEGAWTLPTTLAEGTYQVTLRGEDAAGNAVDFGTAVTVIVDTTPPLAPINMAITTDTGSSSTDFNTTDQTLVLHGTAEPLTTVQVVVAARKLAEVPVDDLGNWSFDAQGTVLPGGHYDVSAHAIDAAGNVGPDATQNLIIDLTLTFDVTILAVDPDSGVLGDHITNGNPVVLAGLAEPTSTVTVVNQADGVTLGTAITDDVGLWALSPVAVPEGTYNFEASSVDQAGNSGTSAAFHLVIDRTAPAAPTIALDPDTGDSASDHLTNANPVGVGGSGEIGATLTVHDQWYGCGHAHRPNHGPLVHHLARNDGRWALPPDDGAEGCGGQCVDVRDAWMWWSIGVSRNRCSRRCRPIAACPATGSPTT